MRMTSHPSKCITGKITPIRLFQVPDDPTGKGFLIVIITLTMLAWLRKFSHKGVTLDDIFHTTRYNLKLATLMVADDRSRGLPVEFTYTKHGREKLKN